MALSTLKCAMLLSALYAPTIALEFVRAQEVPQLAQVTRRQQGFLGGWGIGIPGTECPSDIPVFCTGSLKNPGCCSSGTFCFGSSSTYCCPSETDCIKPVTNFPKCANGDWTLYILSASSDTFFCCPKGQFGVLPLNSYYGGLCVADGEPIAGTRLATKAATIRKTILITTRTVDTLTYTSTSNGRVVTITTVETNTVTLITTATPYNDATGTGTNTNTNSANPTNTDTSPSSTPTNPPGFSVSLGTGAIAGIVIGGLGVIALFLVAFLLYRRRKKTPSPAYAPPTHQQQPDGGADMGVYPTQVKSPALSNAGTVTVVGSPGLEYVQPQQQQFVPQNQQQFVQPQQQQHGYEHYGPPPPAAGYSEVQGQNTWNGPARAEIGPGR